MARIRRPEDYQAQRRRILAVASQLFRERGYGATTIEDLADALGVSRAAVYYYYKKKRDILLDICKQAVDSLLLTVRAIDGDLDADVRLDVFIRAFLEVFMENIEAWSIFIQEPSLQHEPQGRRIIAAELEVASLLEILIDEGMTRGSFAAGQPRLVALSILGMCTWVHRWYRSENFKVEEIADQMVRLTRCGLLLSAPISVGRSTNT